MSNLTVSAQLAALTERLTNHIEQTEKGQAEDKQERTLAAAERREIILSLGEVKRDVSDVRQDLSEMKPITDMVSSVRARIAGAMLLLGFLGAIVGSFLAYFKAQIALYFWGS